MTDWISSVADASGLSKEVPIASAMIARGVELSRSDAVYGKGARLAKNARDCYAAAIGFVQARVTSGQILAFRETLWNSVAFDMGLSLCSGRSRVVPPENLEDPSSLAGFWITHGLQGCPNSIEILRVTVREPEYRIGASVAMRSLIDEYKSPVDKLFELVGL